MNVVKGDDMMNRQETNAEYVQFYDERIDEIAEEPIKRVPRSEGWKVIIADDEEAVHTMTKMVVRNFQFEGKGLYFMSAYSGEETLQLLQEHPDTAVILLDVVMETENAGLEVVKQIREQLGNDTVRIILRTGQSGQAPENEVIVNYDINDYKEKTELSVQKLNTMMISSLRTYRDIVRLKESEKALLKAKVEAEQANVAKSQFLANMSHELRTPLNGIMVTAQLLKTTVLNPEQLDYVDMLLDSTERLLPIIDDVLDFSKLEAGKMIFQERWFNLITMAESINKTYLPLARKKGLNFHLEVDESLPKWLCGDNGKLRQVLTNLIGNAIKFTETGEVRLSVIKHVQQVNAIKVHFIVSDTGIGIEAKKRDAIFSAFTQVDGSHTRNYGGTGLGLAISRQIVESMQGEIWVESKFEEGSAFHFTVVLNHGNCPFIVSDDMPMDDYDETVIHEQLKGMRVLIADDDLINRKVMESLLGNMGCVVDVSKDGMDVVRKMDRPCYDMVLLDVAMPELDGYEVAGKIRMRLEACEKYVPIIAISAYHGNKVIDKCVKAGMDGFMVKPIRSEVLYKMISQLI